MAKYNLKDLRISKDLTQKDVADKLGITQQQYSYIEKSGTTSLDIAFKLAEFYDVAVEDIFFTK